VKKTKKEQALRKAKFEKTRDEEPQYDNDEDELYKEMCKEMSALSSEVWGFLFDKFGDRAPIVMVHALVQCICLILESTDSSLSEKNEEIETITKIMKGFINRKRKHLY
jgi:hypothetical protein